MKTTSLNEPTYTINEFENALNSLKNVDIINFELKNGMVYQAIGTVDGLNITWDACGRSFHYSNRLPKYDICNKLPVRISENENEIYESTRVHTFHAPFFNILCRCSRCSLLDRCASNYQNDFPFPCRSFNRQDGKNGIFKLNTSKP